MTRRKSRPAVRPRAAATPANPSPVKATIAVTSTACRRWRDVGYKIRRELADHLPAVLTIAERFVLLELADAADDHTRLAYGRELMATIARRTGLANVKQVGQIIAKIATCWADISADDSARGVELRVVSYVDSRGRPVFAHRGHQCSYRPPTVSELSDLERRAHAPREVVPSQVTNPMGTTTVVPNSTSIGATGVAIGTTSGTTLVRPEAPIGTTTVTPFLLKEQLSPQEHLSPHRDLSLARARAAKTTPTPRARERRATTTKPLYQG